MSCPPLVTGLELRGRKCTPSTGVDSPRVLFGPTSTTTPRYLPAHRRVESTSFRITASSCAASLVELHTRPSEAISVLAGMVELQVTASYEGRSRHAYNRGYSPVPTQPLVNSCRHLRSHRRSLVAAVHDVSVALTRAPTVWVGIAGEKGVHDPWKANLVLGWSVVSPISLSWLPADATDSCWCMHMWLVCPRPPSPFRSCPSRSQSAGAH